MVQHHNFNYNKEFRLESGRSLPEFDLFYSTLGNLNENKDNVIWVCHAFSGSSNVTDWWPGLFGPGKLYDPERHYIICVNMPGSCYGSTGPLTINPRTGKKYYHDFPQLTNRDMVYCFELLRQSLGIEKVHTLIGCSMGGQQAIEWSIICPEVFEHLIAIGANAQHSPWGIAFNETQRMAIETDPTWSHQTDDAGVEGMKTARATALLSYRHYAQYQKTQQETSDSNWDNFRAGSYQRYQGEKLVKRFNAFTYYLLSKAMDSQNVGRKRGGVIKALEKIKAKSLFVGIDKDILFPTNEQKFLAEAVTNGYYEELQSDYGHDGFLLEFEKLAASINNFYRFFGASSAFG
jgi:homoserine O-acetyltransferase